MALQPRDLVNSATGAGSGLRAASTSSQVVSFASGTGTLAGLTAVTRNSSTGNWQVFRGTTSEINTVTANATAATDGTFTLTVNGEVTAAMDHDIDAAGMQAALEALDGVEVGDVTCTQTAGTDLGDSSGQITITWGGLLGGTNITITIQTGSLTGNAHVLATTQAGGGAELNGTGLIKGFVAPDCEVVLSADGEVPGVVMLAGRVHVDDIPLVDDIYTRAELEAGLSTTAFRAQGFIVEGLADWAL